MRAERRILVNTAVLGVGELVGQLANFGFVVLFSRRYGVEVLGWYAFAMALGAVISPFVSLGGTGYLTRELARQPGRAGELFAALRPVQLSSGLLVWALMAVVVTASGVEKREALVVVIVGTYHVLLRMAALFLAPSVAREQLLATAIVGGGHRIIVAVLAAAAIVTGLDAPLALLAMPISAILSLVVAWAYGRGEIPPPASAVEGMSRADLIRASLPFLGTALLAVIYSRGGILLLTALRGEVATGLFAVADRLLVPIFMITGTFAAAVFPALSRLAGRQERMREVGRRCTRLTFLVTIPLAAMLAIFAADVTTVVFGETMRPAAPVLVALAPLAVARSLSSLWFTHCIAVGAEHAAAMAKTRVVIGFFVLATVGIVIAGPIGLAAAIVLSEIALAWSMRSILSRHDQCEPLWRPARGVIAGAGCAVVAAALLPSLALPARVGMVVCIIVIVTVLLDGIQGHDLRFVAAILRNDDREPSQAGRRAPRPVEIDHHD